MDVDKAGSYNLIPNQRVRIVLFCPRYSCMDIRYRMVATARRVHALRNLAYTILLLSLFVPNARATQSYFQAQEMKNPLQWLDTIPRRVSGALVSENALPSSTMYRGAFGIRDYSEQQNARNAYMTLASVFGGILIHARNGSQLRYVIKHGDGSLYPEHPAQAVIRFPNYDMSETRFNMFSSIYKPLGGATLSHLDRNANGSIIFMRPYDTTQLSPVPVAAPDTVGGERSWIEQFYFTPPSGYPKAVPTADVLIQQYPSINPLTPQAFLSPLAAVFNDINSDTAISKLPALLLKKGVFVTTVFSIANPSGAMGDDAFKLVKARVNEQYAGDNLFSPIVIENVDKVQGEYPDFRKMDFAAIGDRPQVAICQALGIHPVYAAVMAGLKATTLDNMKVARLMFVKDHLISQAMLDADSYTHKFTRENWQNHPASNSIIADQFYGGGKYEKNPSSEFYIDVDTTRVEALKDELFDKHEDARENYLAGGVSFNRFLQELGQPPLSEELANTIGEEFFTPTGNSFGTAVHTDV